MPTDNLARSFAIPVNQPTSMSAEVIHLFGKPISPKPISPNELIRRNQQRIQEELAAAQLTTAVQSERQTSTYKTRVQQQPKRHLVYTHILQQLGPPF